MIRINAADGTTTPETLIRVCRFMVAYWKKFKRDILIDMIGVRKHGHNEVDEPAFTQPLMYERIRAMKSLGEQYSVELIKQGVISQEEVDSIRKQINDHFEAEFEQSKKYEATLE